MSLVLTKKTDINSAVSLCAMAQTVVQNFLVRKCDVQLVLKKKQVLKCDVHFVLKIKQVIYMNFLP